MFATPVAMYIPRTEGRRYQAGIGYQIRAAIEPINAIDFRRQDIPQDRADPRHAAQSLSSWIEAAIGYNFLIQFANVPLQEIQGFQLLTQ